jgi:hypothetical protein
LPAHEALAAEARPAWKPETAMPDNPRWFSPPLYGLKTYGDLFTPRQLVALTTFSDLVPEAIARARADALAAGMPDDGRGLDAGGDRRHGLCGGGGGVFGVWYQSRSGRLEQHRDVEKPGRCKPKHFRSPSAANDLGLHRSQSIFRLVWKLDG